MTLKFSSSKWNQEISCIEFILKGWLVSSYKKLFLAIIYVLFCKLQNYRKTMYSFFFTSRYFVGVTEAAAPDLDFIHHSLLPLLYSMQGFRCVSTVLVLVIRNDRETLFWKSLEELLPSIKIYSTRTMSLGRRNSTNIQMISFCFFH